MSSFFSRILSFLMAALAFLFPWANIGKTNAALTIELASNATTGYSWACEIENSNVLSLTAHEYKADSNPAGLVGAGGTEFFYFAVVGEGETDITFTYAQSWEGGETADVVVYHVLVDAQGKVTCTTDAATEMDITYKVG